MENMPENETDFNQIYATYVGGLIAINVVILQALISDGISFFV